MTTPREPLPPPPLDPLDHSANDHCEDSELGVYEGYVDPTQYRAFTPPPRPTMGVGSDI